LRLSLKFVAILATVAHIGAAGGYAQDGSQTGDRFVTAVETGGKLSREEFLSALVADVPYDVSTLLVGITSSDPLVRQVSALQLAEIDTWLVDKDVLEALYQAASDRDPYVADQALASIIRLARLSATLSLSMLGDTRELADFSYASESANSGRTIAITPADLGVTGLFYGDAAKLDRVVELYRLSRDREAAQPPSPEQRSEDPFDLVFDETMPGESSFYARVLRVLLPQSADTNATVILGLLADPDAGLRDIAFDAARFVNPENDTLRGALLEVVKTAGSEDRRRAATALFAHASGRSDLLALSQAPQPDVRAAVLGALLHRADCNSPYFPLALTDTSVEVREAAIEAMTGYYGRSGIMSCLTPLAADLSLSSKLREQVLYAIEPVEYGATVSIDVDAMFAMLRPVLSDRSSALYQRAWDTYDNTLLKTKLVPSIDTSRAIRMFAAERLLGGIDKSDEQLICILRDLDRDVLTEDTTFLAALVEIIDADWSIGGCAQHVLTRVYSHGATPPDMAARIVDKIMAMTYVPDDLLGMVTGSAAFRKHWRDIAARVNGEERLSVFREAEDQGLVSPDAASVYVEILLGQTTGLGLAGQSSYERNYGAQYRLMPAAVSGLLARGPEGRAILSNFLKGNIGGPLAREVIADQLGDLKAVRPEDSPARPFAGDLVAALHDRDWHVRWATLYALPTMLTEVELIAAIKPLFTDPSEQIHYVLMSLLTDELISRTGQQITGEDLATLLSSMLNHRETYARQRAAENLPRLQSRLSPAFVKNTVARLLADPDQYVVEEALSQVPRLGAPGLAALQDALDGPAADKLFQWQLHATVRKLTDKDRDTVLSRLRRLQEKFPDNADLLRALAAGPENKPQDEATLEQQLSSADEDVRDTAIAALSKAQVLSPSQRYLAALVAEATGSFLKEYLGDVIERIRPYVGMVPQSGSSESFPSFPWPPPKWSFKEVIPTKLLGNGGATLGDASARIVTALRRASQDYDYGLFEIPGGFIVLARLERINADGTPLRGRSRWDDRPQTPSNLTDYLVELFYSPPGYFRIIAFAVTGEEPIETSDTAQLPDFSSGAKTLPDDIAQLPLAGREAYALVYTFERRGGGELTVNYQGSPSGLTHLINAGIWGALEESQP